MSIGPRLPVLSIIGFGAAACGDPRLDLSFEVRPPYRDAIAAAVVQVFEPAVAAPFRCEDLAYQRVAASVVALGRVSELETDALSTPISDIDRVAGKVLWIDGLDDQRRRLVTGCAEVGEVSEDTEVAIVAEPVPVVSPPAEVSLSATLGTTVGRTVAISVADALGRPIQGIDARYAVEGAAGSGSTGQAQTDEGGKLNISPNLPTRPGPFVLDVRVRWADSAPVLLSGVIAPEPEVQMIPGTALDYRAGAIGPGQERGVAVLVSDGLLDSRVVLLLGSGGSLQMRSSARLTGIPALGLVSFEGRAPDRVIAVGAAGWDEIGPDGTVTPRSFTKPAGASLPISVHTTGACGQPPRVLVEFDENPIAIYDPLGGMPVAPSFSLNDPGAVDRATVSGVGCVADQDGSLHRVLLAGFGNSIGLFAAVPNDAGMLVADFWFALPGGVSFTPAIPGARRELFGTQLSVNDIVVSRASLQTRRGADLESVRVQIDGTDVVPNIPLSTAAGDLDGDGLVDVVSLFNRGPDTLAVWAVLGRAHEGRRILGDVDLPGASYRQPMLMLADVDGDRLDDIIIGDRPLLAVSSRVAVYRMGN